MEVFDHESLNSKMALVRISSGVGLFIELSGSINNATKVFKYKDADLEGDEGDLAYVRCVGVSGEISIVTESKNKEDSLEEIRAAAKSIGVPLLNSEDSVSKAQELLNSIKCPHLPSWNTCQDCGDEDKMKILTELNQIRAESFARKRIEKTDGPDVGDFIYFPEEHEVKRVAYDYGDRIQVGSMTSSYHMSDSGGCGYSGGLDETYPKGKFKFSGSYKDGQVWVWDRGMVEGNNGVSVMVPFRFYEYIGGEEDKY